MTVLRAVWSWEPLGAAYADDAKNLSIPTRGYRLAVIMGVQPTLARFLFDDAGAGTPQRFSWVTGVDPDLPEDPPDWPGPLDWKPPAVGKAQPRHRDRPRHPRRDPSRPPRPSPHWYG